MVLALLAGTKTQTRRVVKNMGDWSENRVWTPAEQGHGERFFRYKNQNMDEFVQVRCPYGQPGDRLWVRETWDAHEASREYDSDALSLSYRVEYRAGGPHKDFTLEGELLDFVPGGDFDDYQLICARSRVGKFRPSIHMPRWASRILLEVTAVRVERLQDISEEDAKAEGIDEYNTSMGGPWFDVPGTGIAGHGTAKAAYQALWESINGPGSWKVNPWVWGVEFKVVQP